MQTASQRALSPAPPITGDLCLLRLHEQTIAAPLKAHTPCSAGLDHPTQSEAVLKEGENPAKGPTGVWGPLPKEIVGLILGKSSLSIKGIPVIPGVVDSDYTGEIVVFMRGKGLHTFPPKPKIAPLLLLPYWVPGTLSAEKGDQGFGNTGTRGIYWNQNISF